MTDRIKETIQRVTALLEADVRSVFALVKASDADGTIGKKRVKVLPVAAIARRHGGTFVGRTKNNAGDDHHFAVFQFNDHFKAKKFSGELEHTHGVVPAAIKESVEYAPETLDESGTHKIVSPHDGSEHPAEMVDGVLKHTHNSEGRPIHHTAEGRANFHKWFGDSKVTDEHGRPRVMYHGTTADFTEFRHSRSGNLGPGIYVSRDAADASGYAGTHGKEGQRVLPVYAKITNPVHVRTSNTSSEDLFGKFPAKDDAATIDAAAKAGHDGVIVHGTEKNKWGETSAESTVFHPHQIKSAIGNKGTFSSESPHIHESFDPAKGAFRTKGGKFASLKKTHGAQWVPHISPKVRLTVESLGGKVKAWTSGGGLAFVFEDAEKANKAFELLRESGHRVSKHDLPGVICFHGMLGESITEGSAVIAMQGSITPCPLVLAARINARLNRPQDNVTEDFSQVFTDEEAAEVAAVGLAKSHNKQWAVLALDDDEDDCIEYLALPLDDAFERVEVDPSASIHAMYDATGNELTDLDDDADDAQMNESEVNALTERHSVLSRLSNAQARKKLAGGMKRRMRSARRSARNRLRRGFIYNAKSKARSALHRPNG